MVRIPVSLKLAALLAAAALIGCGGGGSGTDPLADSGAANQDGTGGDGGSHQGDAGHGPPDGGAGTQDSGSDASIPDECNAIQVSAFEPLQVPGWFLADAAAEQLSEGKLRLELLSRPGQPLQPGTFDLSAAPDNDYATCAHCVLLLEGGDEPATASRAFFQRSGLLTAEVVPQGASTQSKGSLSNVVLQEVTIDPNTSAVTFKPSGACYALTHASWDTTIPEGTPCNVAEDCGDTSTRVCDRKTAKCAAAGCGNGVTCPGGEVCMRQTDDALIGACYQSCTPFSSGSCPTGSVCKVMKFDHSAGVCMLEGQVPSGGACEPSIVSTGCAEGNVCHAEIGGTFCRQPCDFWSSSPTCPMIQACVAGSTCSNDAVDPAPIDAPCDSAAPEGNPCGLEGQAARGACVSEGVAVMCRKICRMNSETDCTAPATCREYYGSAGVCQ